MLLGTALALSCAALLGCTAGGQRDAGGPTGTAPGPAAGAATGAAASMTVGAELRAGLTFLLTERVHVVATTSRRLAASSGDRDSAGVRATVELLDANTVAVADTLGASYRNSGAALLPALRRLDLLLLDHVAARAAGATPEAEQALAALPDAHRELARDLRRISPSLPEADVATVSAESADALLAVTGAVLEGDPRQFALLRATAGQAPATAELLARGVAADDGLVLAGPSAAQLRSQLTGLLAEQALLTGALATVLHESDGDPAAPLPVAALAAMNANAVALADTVGAAYPAAALPVVTAYQSRAQALSAYATARASGQAGADQVAALEAFPEQLGAAVERHVPELPASRTAAELAPAGASLRAAVDSAATGDPEAPDDLLRAAADVPAPAALMAAAIAEDLGLS